MSNWEQAHILQFWAPATGPGVWTSGMAKRPPKRKKQDLDPWPDDAAKPDPWGELSMNPWDVDGVRHFDPWETAPADTSSSSCSRVSLEVGAKLLASASVKTAFNEYELKGADPVDCKARWNQGCPRKCNLEGCKPRALQLKDLQSLCRCFWGISSHERAQLLFSKFLLQAANITDHHQEVTARNSRHAPVCFWKVQLWRTTPRCSCNRQVRCVLPATSSGSC